MCYTPTMGNTSDANVASELDVTQLASLPDDKLLDIGLTADEICTLRSLPPTQLSSMIPLVVATGKKRAVELSRKLPFDPEIDCNGHRRCVYVSNTGIRCEEYGDKDVPLCKKHIGKATSLGTYFQSPKLRETYEAFVTSKDKMRGDGEIALMRTMLSALVGLVREDGLNMEIIGAISALSDKITVVVERMSKISQLTPEHIQRIMTKMVDVASEYIAPEKLEEFASRIDDIELDSTSPILRTRLVPDGDKIKAVSYQTRIDGALVQKKATIDVAESLGVE